MYLGEDVLKLNGNNLCPVQWTGYDQKLEKYQGEILEKRQIQNKFKDKLKHASHNSIKDPNWDPLKLVFKNIFKTFNSTVLKELLSNPKSFYGDYDA